MEFNTLLHLVGDAPAFESAFLMAGNIHPENVTLQLTRWTKSGRLIQLRRGLYSIAPPYQKAKPHPFVIANLMQKASYVSAQSALAYYGLIPDTVRATVSVTAGRPERWETPMGIFVFRHMRPEYLHGYRMVVLSGKEQALVATPEKALLDLVYLQPGGDSADYLTELRLQNLELLDLNELQRQAELFHSPKLRRAVGIIARLTQNGTKEYEPL
jgi:predicted transcriptional regulator of viral defense system